MVMVGACGQLSWQTVVLVLVLMLATMMVVVMMWYARAVQHKG